MTLPWYKKGLKFGCTQCGQCCTGSPGYVWITKEEVEKAAEFLKITPELFMRRYTRRVGPRIALTELAKKNYDCVFLKDNRCTIYSVRPEQCRKFPWWPGNLKSRRSWEETAKRCEGINHENAPTVTLEEIQKALE